jgi:Ca2+-dependent lipid-binding protein
MLYVLLKSATHLVAKDVNGKSDPFVEISLGDTKHKSKVAKNTLEPVWSERFKFIVTDARTDVLSFAVFDWDRVGANDKLGHIDVPVRSIAHHRARDASGRVRIDKQFTLQSAK